MNIDKEKLIQALKKNRYDEVRWFDTKEEAAQYLDENIQGKIVGFGDSATMETIKLNKILSENNAFHGKLHTDFSAVRAGNIFCCTHRNEHLRCQILIRSASFLGTGHLHLGFFVFIDADNCKCI